MSKKIAVIGECMIELSEKGADVNAVSAAIPEHFRLYRPGRSCGINRSLRNGAGNGQF